LSFGWGERFGVACFELGELASLALLFDQRGLEPGFEGPGDEAVLRLAPVELALRAAGLELGALNREPLALQSLFVLLLELADGLGAGAHPGRGDSFEERGGDRFLQARAAE
jgi:hypothetical protein